MLHPRYKQTSGGIAQQLAVREKLNEVFYEGRVVPEHTPSEHFYRDKEDGALYPSVTTVLSVINKPYLKQWAVNRGIEHIVTWASANPTIIHTELYAALELAKVAHKTRLDEASMWGTDGHNLVDKYVDTWIKNGEKPKGSILDMASVGISLEGRCAALGAEKFFNTYTLFPIVSEKKILSKKMAIGGTLDSLWLIGDVYKGREGDVSCSHEWNDTGKKVVCAVCGREETLSLILIDLKTSNQITSIDYAMQVSTYSSILTEMCQVKPKTHWILQLNKNKPEYTIGIVDDVANNTKAFRHAKSLSDYMRSNLEPVRLLNQKKVIQL